MKKRLVSLNAVLVLAFVCCFGGVAFAQQDIEFMTDWRIYPGGSSVYSNDMTGRTCNKDIAGVPAVHRVTKWTHVPESTGTYINKTYSAVYLNGHSNRVSDGFVTFTAAARKLIPFASGYGARGGGYILKIQSASESQNQYFITGSWAPDHYE